MQQLLRNKKVIIGVIAAIIVAVAIFVLFPKAQSVVTGQEVIVTLRAASLDDVYGYEFHINYNNDDFQLVDPGGLVSLNNEIYTIFKKSFEGYELVGATMVGDKVGITGRNVSLCQVKFIAKKDGMLSEMPFTLSNVNIVKSNLDYETNVSDWTFKVSTADSPAADSSVTDSPAVENSATE